MSARAEVDEAGDGNRRPGTHHPRLARERALKVLFQADVRGVDARDLLARLETTRGALRLLDELEPDSEQVERDDELRMELRRRERLPLDDYTRTLVAGVAGHRHAIDQLLGDVADRWAVARMPVVDRNLLRLATYELALQDTPDPVVMDEAVALAGGFAGEKARPFVNGVLETIRRRVVAGEVDLGEASGPPGADDATRGAVGAVEAPEGHPVPAAPSDGVADEAVADGSDAAQVVDVEPGDAGTPGRGSGDDPFASHAPEPADDPDGDEAWGEAIDLLDELDATQPLPDDEAVEEQDVEDAAAELEGDVDASGPSAGEAVVDEEIALLLGQLDEDGEPLAPADDEPALGGGGDDEGPGDELELDLDWDDPEDP